ncbi:histidinol-phosphate aminotransferase [Pilimelia terevasa]|uniref:Histidinol-phosphate aminotransferase n=1 Tax=Pilimelia terevasa TaxID=53372 RepID=A0A8J3FH98_9ACTN|nr:histidinol-phosphate transaminase [Pilimelia terevasa]GGK20361.1 histidinol-phosphate aminotransferase [Pilimelia terevasa]
MTEVRTPTAGTLLRREVEGLPAYDPGADPDEVARASGVTPVIKLSNNESPFGVSPTVTAAVSGHLADIFRYPDPTGKRLAGALGRALAVPPERIVLGNGSENILELLCQAVLDPGDLVVTQAPGFSLHDIFPSMMGARVEKVPVTPEFGFDATAWKQALAACPKLVFLANPCNPTGAMFARAELAQIVADTPPSTLLVLDEAYHEFARPNPEYPDGLEMLRDIDRPWIVLRTFSKAYGLAGLRVGYGVASSTALVRALDRVRTPYNVNRLGQEAAVAALGDQAHLAETVRRTGLEIARVAGRLRAAGLRVAPSSTNFLFIDTGRSAHEVALQLHRRGIIVKAWREPGYESFVRASLAAPEQNDVFIERLLDICGRRAQ